MKKRTIVFGNYDTAVHGWTLTGCTLGDPEQKTNYVEKTNGDGTWDLSTVMTDGIPRYKDRPLTVTLECSEGNRAHRQSVISELVNLLDGLEYDIIHPDYPGHYLHGRLHVAVNVHNLSYAAVTVTGTCQPWLYRQNATAVKLIAASAPERATLRNAGRLAVVPEITVTGSSADVLLVYGANSIAMTAGTYEWPTLLLTPGDHAITYSGTGTVTITYREAVLR